MFEASIRETQPSTMAYKVMRGDYEQIPDGFAELYGWIARHGLVPIGMPAAVYLTMPGEDAEYELWAPVTGESGETPLDPQGIGVKHIQPETVASTMYTGPYDGIGATYGQLEAWVAEQGMRVIGPPREIYYSDPEEVPEEEYLTEVQVPVTEV